MFFSRSTLNQWLFFFMIFSIFMGSLVSLTLIKRVKEKELFHAKLIYYAQKKITENSKINETSQALLNEISKQDKDISILILDRKNQPIYWKNIIEPASTQDFLSINKEHLSELSTQEIDHRLFFSHSPLIRILQYIPYALVSLIVIIAISSYFNLRGMGETERRLIWMGMTKETAHQIGTPLSSLLGWLELLKDENIDQKIINEMAKDLGRLNLIAERFSMIGSTPSLVSENVVEATRNTFDYMRTRTGPKITFDFFTETDEIIIPLNKSLYAWVIENLCVNAIDSMKIEGQLKIYIYQSARIVTISIEDTGKGIPKDKKNQIFEPGYSTKKRGWGLGLSLARRIVEEYHNGQIYVVKSKKGKGTEMRIILPLRRKL